MLPAEVEGVFFCGIYLYPGPSLGPFSLLEHGKRSINLESHTVAHVRVYGTIDPNRGVGFYATLAADNTEFADAVSGKSSD